MNMADEVMQIELFNLIAGYMMLVIPFGFFWYFNIGLGRTSIIAVLRMSIQLLVVGFYLETIFRIDSAYINLLWLMAMIAVGVITTINRTHLRLKYFIVPISLALLSSIFIIDAFFLGIVLDPAIAFNARYLIPVSGMILGNAMNYNIVGLNSYFERLIREEELYYYLMVNTGDRKQALSPFVSAAMIKALNPLLASMMVMGLISLPGMMTGQILGGSLPATAIKYQIMIAVAVFSGGTLNLGLSILFSNRFIFDKYGRLNRDILKKKNE